MNFKIGQKVVCIDSKNSNVEFDSVYTIKHIEFVYNHRQGKKDYCVQLFEICPDNGFISYDANRFKAIEQNKSAISDLVNNFKEVEEKSDIQINKEELV